MATFNLQPHFPPFWYKGSLFPYSTREQWLLLCRWRLFSNNESAVQAKTPASLHEPFSNLIWVKRGESESWMLKYQGGFSLILGGFGLLDKQPCREAGLRVIVALAFLFTMTFNNNALPFIKVTHSEKKKKENKIKNKMHASACGLTALIRLCQTSVNSGDDVLTREAFWVQAGHDHSGMDSMAMEGASNVKVPPWSMGSLWNQ